MKRTVIARKYLPVRALDLGDLAVVYLMLERFAAPGWVWGVVGCLYGLLFVSGHVVKWTEVDVHPSQVPK